MKSLNTKRSWILPDEPRPIRLVNSIWAERRHINDDLITAADLGEWLKSAGFVVHEAVGSSVAEFRDLRHALRRLAAFATNDHREFGAATLDFDLAIGVVNESAARSPRVPTLKLVGKRLVRRDAGDQRSVDTALSTVAIEAIDLFTGEHRELIRACNAPGCVLYFMQDHPRRNWCGDACGNRARAARHYQKNKSER